MAETLSNKNDIIAFIEMYESFPELWNTNTNEYKERNKKLAALQQISEAFNLSNVEVRRKIHNLRCQFNSELRKIKRKSADQGLEEGKIHSEWKFFEHMSFLIGANNNTKMRLTKKTETDESINSYDPDDSDDNQEDPITTTHVPATTKKCKRSQSTERIFIPNTDVRLSQPIIEEDYRIFGEFVASELRSLSNNNAKKLKLMISKAIVEVSEREYLENNPKDECY